MIPYLKKANKHTDLCISTLIKIADALDVTLDELVGRKGKIMSGAKRPQRKGEDERKILYKIFTFKYIVADIESGILVSDI